MRRIPPKLGAPSPPRQGADVYSYAADENDEVLNPNLAAHLAHWGIDSMKMEKSEKNMAELQAPAPSARTGSNPRRRQYENANVLFSPM